VQEPGSVVSAPVEMPTEAALLTIIVLPDHDGQGRKRGTVPARWLRRRRRIRRPGHH